MQKLIAKAKCSVPLCARMAHCRGLCMVHYLRQRKGKLRPEVPIVPGGKQPIVVRQCQSCGSDIARKKLKTGQYESPARYARRITCLRPECLRRTTYKYRVARILENVYEKGLEASRRRGRNLQAWRLFNERHKHSSDGTRT